MIFQAHFPLLRHLRSMIYSPTLIVQEAEIETETETRGDGYDCNFRHSMGGSIKNGKKKLFSSKTVWFYINSIQKVTVAE